MTNTLDVHAPAENDFKRTLPGCQVQHAASNTQLAAGFTATAHARNASPAQLALAWVLAQGKILSRSREQKKRKYLQEKAAAVDLSSQHRKTQRLKNC